MCHCHWPHQQLGADQLASPVLFMQVFKCTHTSLVLVYKDEFKGYKNGGILITFLQIMCYIFQQMFETVHGNIEHIDNTIYYFLRPSYPVIIYSESFMNVLTKFWFKQESQ